MSNRLNRKRLLAESIALAGSDDFGEPTWEAGFDVLLDSLLNEARLHQVGVHVAGNDLVNALVNRLSVWAWRDAHPEVADEQVDQPIIIIGAARTGTTILFDLLAQDPDFRAPLTWEVGLPNPPPTPEAYRTDPRIDEVQAIIERRTALNPGLQAFHPVGARLAQECTRMTGIDFYSTIFSLQYHVPSYDHWLRHEADVTSAYRWHRRYLQHLQSRGVVGQWLLKSPSHLGHLDALAAEYPDALVVQTHRDPLQVIASISALAHHSRRLVTDHTTVEMAARQYSESIVRSLSRGMDARDRHVFPHDRVVDIRFGDFMTDPFAAIRRIYDRLGRELTPATEARMRAFLTEHPVDRSARYSWADTGLDEAELRPHVAAYQERYQVASETLA